MVKWLVNFFQMNTQAVDKMQNYDKPFLCMMSAISTHIPYSLDGISNLDDKISIDVSEIESDEISRYLLACNFVDYSFGKFMEKLESSGLLENSILIVYGDHGAGLQDLQDVKKIYEYNGKDYNENIENLLNVLLIPSANDAAIALAEHVSGSVSEFSNLMNKKAKELGCKNTNFVNPNGVHNEN